MNAKFMLDSEGVLLASIVQDFHFFLLAIRGAVSFALALRFEFEEKKRNVIVTATLVIVLFTTIVFGGGTMPLLKVRATIRME